MFRILKKSGNDNSIISENMEYSLPFILGLADGLCAVSALMDLGAKILVIFDLAAVFGKAPLLPGGERPWGDG